MDWTGVLKINSKPTFIEVLILGVKCGLKKEDISILLISSYFDLCKLCISWYDLCYIWLCMLQSQNQPKLLSIHQMKQSNCHTNQHIKQITSILELCPRIHFVSFLFFTSNDCHQQKLSWISMVCRFLQGQTEHGRKAWALIQGVCIQTPFCCVLSELRSKVLHFYSYVVGIQQADRWKK